MGKVQYIFTVDDPLGKENSLSLNYYNHAYHNRPSKGFTIKRSLGKRFVNKPRGKTFYNLWVIQLEKWG